MCRNIKILFNFDPPATEEEIKAAALQYVRKISGFNKPSAINEEAFTKAVDSVALTTSILLNSLKTNGSTRDREIEKQKAKIRAEKRFKNRV